MIVRVRTVFTRLLAAANKVFFHFHNLGSLQSRAAYYFFFS